MTHVLDVVTFGEAMLLLVADRPGPLEAAGSFYKRSAGAETNVASGLARLGLKVAWARRHEFRTSAARARRHSA